MSAGRDIQLGTIGADFNNDVIANGTLTFNAGRDILIDGFADILSDNFGLNTGGDLVFDAGRNIGILNLAGSSASVTASGSGGGNAFRKEVQPALPVTMKTHTVEQFVIERAVRLEEQAWVQERFTKHAVRDKLEHD